MKFFRPNTVSLTINQLLLLVCSYIVLVLNLPFIVKTSEAVTQLSQFSWLFLGSVPLFLLSLTLIIQSVFSFRFLVKPVLILSVMLSAVIFYCTFNYGTVFDYGMVQNIIETDSAEAVSYLNLSAVVFVGLLGGLPAVAIARVRLVEKSALKECVARLKLVAMSLGSVVLIAVMFYSNYASIGRNNRELVGYITPYAMYDSIYKYSQRHYFAEPLPYRVIDANPTLVRHDGKKRVTVMVLGETARAQNFALNGYDKPTNPYTRRQGVIYFSNVISCGTATAVSVPCMFSRFNHDDYDKRIANAQQNALDIIHLAGTDVTWISNNNGSCKGVCNRLKTMHINTDKANPLCDGEFCFDEALLGPLEEKLQSLTSDNTLIVLHMIGSHGPTYFRRYPKDKRVFTPDCQRSDIQNCSHEQLVNTYDNTIAYTDYVLSQIITRLDSASEAQGIETSMIYMSDHGESLGESGIYLHGLPYAFAPNEQTHVPLMFWANAGQTEFDLNCLSHTSKAPVSHDNFFDVLLNVTQVQSSVYQPNNDPFFNCKNAGTIAQADLQSTKRYD